jgi:hypothetical protein
VFSASREARDRNAPTNANQIRLQTSRIRQEHRPIRYQLPAKIEFPTGTARLKSEGHEPAIPAKTGLIIDPYFSGTKVAWILDHVPGAGAERSELMFGTVDCYLRWRLTGDKVHTTDATNASRTLLFNIHTGQ